MITVITPTGDRPLAFSLCLAWIEHQTVAPSRWIIIDDGKVPMSAELISNLPSFARYIRREPQADDPKHTLALNLRVALPLVTGDRILIMEDDEYYAPGYIEAMVRALDNHLIAGLKNAKYYHLPTGGHFQNHNDHHASLAETAFRAVAIPEIYALIADNDDPFIDIKIWKKFLAQGKLFDDTDGSLYVGMKGLPGRPGIGGGHKTNLYRQHDTPDRKILRQWCPKDFQVYADLMGQL